MENISRVLDETVRDRKTSTPVKTPYDIIENAKKAVCSHYLKGRCKHGRVGNGCNFDHPKLCFSFTKSGNDGCKKQDCEYFHPKLCNASVRKECCSKEKECRFFHLKIYRASTNDSKAKTMIVRSYLDRR